MGTNITALIRDLLILYANMPASQAQHIADEIEDNQIAPVDWLVTSNGTTFSKTFDPKIERA